MNTHETVFGIMFVDDVKNLGDSFSRIMRSYKEEFPLDYQLYHSFDGSEALELFIELNKEGKINLVITDYNMPKMNGYDLLKCIRQIAPSVRIILSSGTPVSKICQEFDYCIDKGSSGYSKEIIKSIKRYMKEYKRK